MSHPWELGGLLWEREAEYAYSKIDEIEKAAAWCRSNSHKLEFLTAMRRILTEENMHLSRFGLSDAYKTGAVKYTSALTLLTPSQALRLLECYKRVISDSPRIWKAKNIREMDAIEAELRRDKIILQIKNRNK